MKTSWTTVPWKAMGLVAQAFTKGMTSKSNPEKVRGLYGWRDTAKKLGLVETRRLYLDSLYRHLEADVTGIPVDDDSGLPPIVHVVANALILLDLSFLDEEAGETPEGDEYGPFSDGERVTRVGGIAEGLHGVVEIVENAGVDFFVRWDNDDVVAYDYEERKWKRA